MVRVRIAALVNYMGLHGILVYYKHGTTLEYLTIIILCSVCYYSYYSHTCTALTPHLETMSFDFDKFFSLLHAVGGITAILFYMLLTDR